MKTPARFSSYFVSLVAVMFASACSRAESPPPAKPANAAAPAAAPAPTAAKPAPAPSATPAPAVPRFVQAAGKGSLEFSFVQAGAENHGAFRQFTTELAYDAAKPAASSLKVSVQIGSLATQEKERDDTLKSAELFDVSKYPTAKYLASSFAKRSDGSLEAVGKLTLRGVTRDLRVPLTIRESANGVELSGETTIKRLDYGVGQGDWQSTEWVGDEVKLTYKVPLARSR